MQLFEIDSIWQASLKCCQSKCSNVAFEIFFLSDVKVQVVVLLILDRMYDLVVFYTTYEVYTAV